MAKEMTTEIEFKNDDFGPNLHFRFDKIIIASLFPIPPKKIYMEGRTIYFSPNFVATSNL